MGLLPELAYEYTEREVTDEFRGYNHNLKIADGEFFDTENLSSAFFPLLANRKKRGRITGLTAPQALLAKEHLAYVDGGTLYYNGSATAITGLSAGEKQLVSMGAFIAVFPDKKYYNTADPTDYGNMEATYSSTGNVKYTMCRADGSDYPTPTVSDTAPVNPSSGAVWIDTSGSSRVVKIWSTASVKWEDIPTVYTKLEFISNNEMPALFQRYDGVTVTGAEVDDVNGDKIVYGVGTKSQKDFIVFVGLLEEAVTQTTGSVRIERKVPDMDFVVEAQNRLWGCKYGVSGGKNLNEIYCCTLGDFKNWRQYMGISTDSWTASVGSDGPWTGAVNYLGYPMFFKEDRIHRVVISSQGAHQITETVCRGVQAGSSKSLQVVNETLFYKSRSDICAYQGSFPQGVSEALGELPFYDAVAGAIGDRYYVSMKDGSDRWNLFVLDVKRGLWMREDDLHARAFARLGDELYCIDAEDDALLALQGTDGELEPYVSWKAETGLMYYQYPDRKYVQRYNFRLYMEDGAEADVFIMYDSNGEWVRQGRIRMRGTRTVTLPIRPRRCDHLRVRIVGKGEIRLYSIARILSIGSDIG